MEPLSDEDAAEYEVLARLGAPLLLLYPGIQWLHEQSRYPAYLAVEEDSGNALGGYSRYRVLASFGETSRAAKARVVRILGQGYMALPVTTLDDEVQRGDAFVVDYEGTCSPEVRRGKVGD